MRSGKAKDRSGAHPYAETFAKMNTRELSGVLVETMEKLTRGELSVKGEQSGMRSFEGNPTQAWRVVV